MSIITLIQTANLARSKGAARLTKRKTRHATNEEPSHEEGTDHQPRLTPATISRNKMVRKSWLARSHIAARIEVLSCPRFTHR